MEVFEELVRLRARGEPCALATIVKTRGSTPGKTSMRMLVRRDVTRIFNYRRRMLQQMFGIGLTTRG